MNKNKNALQRGLHFTIDEESRIIFANQLRGFAAFLVVISHWFGVYWGARETVAFHTASPIQEGVSPLAYHLVSINPNFGLGPLGVSIFFLISGFVIPVSIAKNSARQFLIQRCFRIFPTYWIGLSIGLLCVVCSSKFWNIPLFWNVEIIVSNYLLLNNIFQIINLDLVSWTLAIELKFYLAVTFLRLPIKEGRVLPIFVFSCACLLLNLCWTFYLDDHTSNAFLTAIGILISELVYVQFMLIGCFFYFGFQHKISSKKLTVCLIVQFSIFFLSWKYGGLSNSYPVVPKIYLFGFFIFFASYTFRRFFRRNIFFDFLAKISFPVYLIHSLVGYVVIKICMHFGLSFYFAILVAMFSVTVIAMVLHETVETSSNNFGKRLSMSS